MSLKEELIAKGHKFVSETDTEVVAHLIEDVYDGDFVKAVNAVLDRIEGSYSLVFMCQDYPDTLICTKKDIHSLSVLVMVKTSLLLIFQQSSLILVAHTS